MQRPVIFDTRSRRARRFAEGLIEATQAKVGPNVYFSLNPTPPTAS